MISPTQQIERSTSTVSSSSFGKRSIKSCLRHRCACGKFVEPEDDLEDYDRIQARNAQHSASSISSITRERDAKKRCRECKFKYEHGHRLVVPPTEISIDRRSNNVILALEDSSTTHENKNTFASNISNTENLNGSLRRSSEISIANNGVSPASTKQLHTFQDDECGSVQSGKVSKNSNIETIIFDPFNLGDCEPLHFDTSMSQASHSSVPSSVSRQHQNNVSVMNQNTANEADHVEEDGMSDNLLRALSDDSNASDNVQLLASIDIKAKNSSSPKSKKIVQQNTKFPFRGFDNSESSKRHNQRQRNQRKTRERQRLQTSEQDRVFLKPKHQQQGHTFGNQFKNSNRKKNKRSRSGNKMSVFEESKNAVTSSSQVNGFKSSPLDSSPNSPQSCTTSASSSDFFHKLPVSESASPSPERSIRSLFSKSKSSRQESKSQFRRNISLMDKDSEDIDEMRDEMPTVIIRVNVNDDTSTVGQRDSPKTSSGPNVTNAEDPGQQITTTTTEIQAVESTKPLNSWNTLAINPCFSLRSFVSAISDME